MKLLTTTTAIAAMSALAMAGSQVTARASQWVLDPGHSQILFSYDHLGFSTSFGLFSGFTGDISFDPENPEAGSVSVEIPTETIITGWAQRSEHFLSEDFFDASGAPLITFTSTAIEVTGENTANITGDLTMNNITQPVVLETVFKGVRQHPSAQQPWTGFSATATLLRSDWDMGAFAPFVGDQVDLAIEVEARPAG